MVEDKEYSTDEIIDNIMAFVATCKSEEATYTEISLNLNKKHISLNGRFSFYIGKMIEKGLAKQASNKVILTEEGSDIVKAGGYLKKLEKLSKKEKLAELTDQLNYKKLEKVNQELELKIEQMRKSQQLKNIGFFISIAGLILAVIMLFYKE